MRSVYVTGMGIISALGIGVTENRSALLAMQSGISHSSHLNSLLKDKLPAAEIKEDTATLHNLLRYPGQLFPNRLVSMAALAMEEALGETAYQPGMGKMGFINATSVGGMADVEDHYTELVDPSKSEAAINLLGDTLDCGHCTEELARHFHLARFIGTVSTACSSSANALMYGARLIRNGVLDGAICGGADTLTRFTLNGFNSLKNIDRNPCKPFDANRNGLNLGEGAAYLVLESEEMMYASGRKPLAVFSGFCNYNEAFHPTSPSPEGEGAYRAMKGAIEIAQLKTSDISYINAHGTATINNDIAEAIAMKKLFGENMPAFSSTKCYTGHTLAAAGAIEAIFSVFNIRHNELYPVLNFETPMPEIKLLPLTAVKEHTSIEHVLSNSFGFGGNNASLLFSKYA
ncbi:beta-ketoacyl-[acyl-carrier-protein] synthase family protein [Flavihumibacter profundi]|uniref:beta-ketoacyl-[acyl-carrier-protein] synthase family protein n=1 Tax=Flavihumibacter profundi TaxID=2716883 RepID=UPI001CC7C7B0|nr:beta-ketoacyl-[acyl-carrier-protein] synthase family protein [Flavihumibacter profundi]MBZ5859136.1 beta-ketoacyl-[acyl-carrier-protein] synthase family protein [Flavihumibacter profundi]